VKEREKGNKERKDGERERGNKKRKRERGEK
jgi:hypothetical protein